MGLIATLFGRAPRLPAVGAGPAAQRLADAEHRLNEGMAQEREGHHGAALRCYDEAIALSPDLARAHFNRGNILLDRGDAAQALLSYRRAVELKPDSAAAHCNLGNALLQLGELEASVSALRLAIRLKPDLIDAHISLAAALSDLGRHDEALECLARAIALEPDNPAGYIQTGMTLAKIGRSLEAAESYRQALELQADHADAHLCMGLLLKDIGDVAGALICVRRALEIRPDDLLAHSSLLHTQNFLGDQPSGQVLADARRFGEVAADVARPYTDWPSTADPQGPLRVGLVSGDLRAHPVGYFLEGVLAAFAALEHSQLKFFAYDNNAAGDETTQRLRDLCDGWYSTVALSDEALAQRVRDDSIDILIDLAGHTSENRLAMFAWKPAPLQVSWLGYFATTGLSAMDYFLADPWTLPPGQEPFFTEQVWRLPETRLCFTPPRSRVQVGTLPALSQGYVTFGCFNKLGKMNDSVVQLWARVLQAVPGSRLFLKCGQLADDHLRQRTFERFASQGIQAERLILEGHSERSDYLAAYHRVDIALDPFPFPGGTTTVEALWMGVPVLTLEGERFLARQGVGLLMNAGLDDWVAADADDYVARAVRHTSDLKSLAAFRARLRDQVLTSPIYDAPRFARHLEEALRTMWIQWCATERASANESG
ncbi:MAG: tetratricopeptide repeat protein [Hylemonella sp.]|nr:tetratricopeptide repeat protein [Hylemonella sp.]